MPPFGDSFVIRSATPESTLTLTSAARRLPADVVDHASLEHDVLILFDRFRDPLLRYVCSCGLTIGDGEDVVQDVFLQLFRHLQRNGPRTNLQGWLFRVAHNLALKRRGRQKREMSRVPGQIEAALMVIDPAPGPERRLVDGERRHRLGNVLSALPQRERQCLYLRHNGLRYRDIAKVLGISLGGVAKVLARALERLERADKG